MASQEHCTGWVVSAVQVRGRRGQCEGHTEIVGALGDRGEAGGGRGWRTRLSKQSRPGIGEQGIFLWT